MKKRIGISYTRTLFENYWSWFGTEDLGHDLELVELSFERNNTIDIYSCDAFVLTGGVDVHPALYEGAAEYNNASNPFQPARDRFEEMAYRYALSHQLPILAICRGMQLVNVLQGGKLVQDLGERNAQHRKETTDKEHTVTVQKGTLLHSLTGAVTGLVNSAHHQAIDPDAIGEGLVPSAYAADGITIEGLEPAHGNESGFLLCVQWHPERMRDREQNPFSENIKREFLSAVRKTNMKKLTITDPSTGRVITQVNEDSEEYLHLKFDRLQAARPAWQDTPLAERVAILRNFSSLLGQQIESLAATLSAEVGKPLQQSRNEVNGAIYRIKWLTDNAERYLCDETMSDAEGMMERIIYEPLGIICNISAWNYPYLVGVNVIVPALLAGNTVMYKPSEYATLTGLEIEKWLHEAGVPGDVFLAAVGGRETGETLTDLSFDGYFFTGSYRTGSYIYKKVAARMVPCQCELGGKDPLYVADDITDIKTVAAATADGAFYNNGQSCCAVERIYVHEKIYDRYVEEFLNEVRSWKIGIPGEDGIYIGPLTREDQLSVLEAQVEDACRKGATVLTGGRRLVREGFFFEPTVIVNVNHSMTLMREESFGPVIGIMKVGSDEEALRLMQGSEYGLTASVYSASKERAISILSRTNTGTGYWNCCDRVSAALPWSGRNHSGFGSTLSHAGLRAFTRPKSYHLRG